MPTTELAAEDFDEEGNIDLISLLVKSALVTTRSEGRRAIEMCIRDRLWEIIATE